MTGMSPERTPSEQASIPTGVVLRVIIRSGWIQATLHEGGMQKLGRLFALVPVAKWLGLDRDGWGSFARRHLSFFNSNPFVSPLGLGALARIEHDAHANGAATPDDMIERFSVRLSTPLGAVGDELFWSAIRPQVSLLAVLVAIFAGIWGAVAFIVGFSVFQYAIRWSLFRRGWELGTRVAEVLRDTKTKRLARYNGLAAAACAGAVFVALVMQMQTLVGDTASVTAVLVLCVSAVTGFFIVRGRKSATLALVAGLAWVGVVSIGVEVLSRFG